MAQSRALSPYLEVAVVERDDEEEKYHFIGSSHLKEIGPEFGAQLPMPMLPGRIFWRHPKIVIVLPGS